MKNKIKHFIVDLEGMSEEQSYDSGLYRKIRAIIKELESLLSECD